MPVLRRFLRPATVLTLLVGAILLASAWGGHVDPRQHTAPALLTLVFPFVLTIAAVTAVVLAVTRHWRTLAALCLAAAASWPAISVNAPLPLGGSTATSPAETDTLRVLTWNVSDFMDITGAGLTATMQFILDTDADVVAIQEGELGPEAFTDTPGVAPLAEQFNRQYPYHSTGYHDLMLFSKHPYTVYSDPHARQGYGAPDDGMKEYHFYAKSFDIGIDGRQLRIVNVHLQSIGLKPDELAAYERLTHLNGKMSGMRRSFIEKVTGAFRRRAGEAHVVRHIVDESPQNVIVCGDFNDTPASYTYWTMRADDLRDAFAECHFGPTYTFNQRHVYVNIDHVLYRGALRAVGLSRCKAGGSDHYPLLATFVWTDTP